MSATCEGLSLLWAWGDGAPCRAGALRQYGAQPGSREVAERRPPSPQAWGGRLAPQTCVLASEPDGVRHLVAAGSSAGAGATFRTRPREAVPAPAACPVLCYSRLYLHLGYVGGASHLSSPASCSPQEETGARLLLAWI